MPSCERTSSQSHAGASRLHASARRWRQSERGLSPQGATPPIHPQALAVLDEENTRPKSMPPLVHLQPEEDTSFLVALRVRGVTPVRRNRFCRWLRKSSSLVARQEHAFGPGATPLCPAAPCQRHRVRPNPSLEPTRTGMALGPRGAHCHHSPRGPSATPALAAQLKR